MDNQKNFTAGVERAATISIGKFNFDKIKITAYYNGNAEKPEDFKNIMAKAAEEVETEFCRQYLKIKNEKIEELHDNIRFYPLPSGKKVPSVTSVLSFAAGFPDYPVGCAERGTILHEYMERWGKTGQRDRFTIEEMMEDFPKLAPEFKAVMDNDYSIMDGKAPSVCENLEKIGIEILETEVSVCNEKEEYGGTLDAVGKQGEELFIIDYKSGSDWGKARTLSALKQLAAYANSDYVTDKYGEIKNLLIVPLDVQNKIKIKQPIPSKKDVSFYYSMFLRDRKKMKKDLKI